MTLDEAIQKARDNANAQYDIAQWLYELKLYRMNGTVARIDGKLYVADDTKLKTVHGKTGEVVIGGFREVDG